MNAAVINKNAKLQRVPEACADTNWSREIFGLNAPDRKNSRDLIRQQEQARQKQQQAEKAKKRRWRLQVEALQRECEFYQDILDSGHCEPLSWLWCICRNRLTAAEGQLDLLCGIL